METIYKVSQYIEKFDNGNDRQVNQWFFKSKVNAKEFVARKEGKAVEGVYYKINVEVFSDFEVEE